LEKDEKVIFYTAKISAGAHEVSTEHLYLIINYLPYICILSATGICYKLFWHT